MSDLRQSLRLVNSAARTPLEEKPAIVNTLPSTNTKSSFKSRPSTASSGMLNTPSSNNLTEESHIKVFVRCRPRNEREINENSSVVVSTAAEGLHRGKEIAIQSGIGLSTSMASQHKTYSFDRVFGPESDQQMIFDLGVNNALKEMVEGYNCTVFAYGQTGTGKTHTMLGEFTLPTESKESRSPRQIKPEDQWGVIPRTIHELFELFKQDTSKEYSVKLSFIELYNEELRDLLAPDEDTRKVRIYEESGNVTVHGMEEVYISNPLEGLRTLQEGSFRRQVATTKCNDRSSRSHSVFTITVHMKEMALNGEEFVKTGKLNLVDLAGSENIGRSGAQDKRAREAGMINQSLLTLGRVINSLVERSPHIPYRESKLTRVLQDSLGGQTKTCIIATISPARVSLDETLSTLEYASRAKSIKNKPKVNQTMSKQALIKDYIREIERLRNDLVASRSKNGVYMSADSLKLLEDENESRRVLVEEQKLRMEVLEDQVRRHKKQNEVFEAKVEEITEELVVRKEELLDKTHKLEATQAKLSSTLAELDDSKSRLEAETALRKRHQETEVKLSEYCDHITNILTKAVDQIDSINQIVSDAFTKEKIHIKTVEALKLKLAGNLTDIEHNMTDVESTLKDDMHDFVENLSHSANNSQNQLTQIIEMVDQATKGLENEKIEKLRQSLACTFGGFQDVIFKLKGIEVDVLSGFKDRLGTLKTNTTQSISLVVKDIDTLNLTLSQNFKSIDNSTKKAFSDMQTSLLEQLNMLDGIKHDFSGKVDTGLEQIASLDDKLNVLMTEQIKKSSVFKDKFMEFVTDAHNRQVQEFESILKSMKHEFVNSVNAVELLRTDHTDGLRKLRSALHDHTSMNIDISRASLSGDIKRIELEQTGKVEKFKNTTLQQIETEISSLVTREVELVDAETDKLHNMIAVEQSRCDQHQSQANEATESISSGLVNGFKNPISAEIDAIKSQVLQDQTRQSAQLDAVSSSVSGKISVLAQRLDESERVVQTITPNNTLTTSTVDLKRSRNKTEYLEEISKMDRPKRTKL